MPFLDDEKEAFLRFDSIRENILDINYKNSLVKDLSLIRLIKFPQIISCMLYMFMSKDKSDIMVIDPI